MKNNLRRILSLLLALTLAFSPLTAAAEGRPEDTDEPELIEQITEETPEESSEETQSPEESAPTEPEETGFPEESEPLESVEMENPSEPEEADTLTEEYGGSAPVSASAIMASGKCGKNLTWSVDNNRTLIISGTGDMYNYEYTWNDLRLVSTAPWSSYNVKSVITQLGVTSIGQHAFAGCQYLSSITLSNSIQTIHSGAFLWCTNLKSILIPASVHIIASDAFQVCVRLEKIEVDANNIAYSSYGGILFDKNMRSLIVCPAGICASLLIPDGVLNIYDSAFINCSGVDSVRLPDSLKTIGSSAFLNSGLTAITIPKNVKSIGDSAFVGCYTMDRIDVVQSNPYYSSVDGVLFNKEKTKLIQCPGNKAGSYSVPDGVKTIAEYAFDECNRLISVSFPSNSVSIEERAFNFCHNLKEVVFHGKALFIHDTAFYGTQATVRYPQNILSWNSEINKNYGGTLTWVPYISGLLQQDGSFRYVAYSNEMHEYSYHYDESWFARSSSNFQSDLAKMSLRIAMSASDVRIVSNQWSGDGAFAIKELMDDLGFTYYNDSIHYPKPTTDSIGYAIGQKTLTEESGKTSTLLLIAIRGGGYGAEWGGNFRIGAGFSEHQGFLIASSQVIQGINDYVAAHGDGFKPNVKVWITGYSRAAATANLVASKLASGASVPGLNAENLYAYCFECPKNTVPNFKNSSQYKNIYNIVNPIDLIPKVAMGAWGFGRYGTTFVTASAVNDDPSVYRQAKAGMQNEYKKILQYNVDHGLMTSDQIGNFSHFVKESSSQTDDFELISDRLAAKAGNREIYVKSLQPSIMAIMEDALGNGTQTFDPNKAFMSIVTLISAAVTPSVLDSLGNVANAHYMELCLAWVDSGAVYQSSAVGHQKVYVACPVDVTVYDANGTVVAEFIDDTVQEDTLQLSAYTDENGQKVINLPNNGEYSVCITATGNGTMNYTVAQYDGESSIPEKVSAFCDIEITEGDVLTSQFANSDTDIELILPNGEALEPTQIQDGDSIQQIAITADCTDGGTASGGGYFVFGEYAQVSAYADNTHAFVGWYIGEELVSVNMKYRFPVSENAVLTARFVEKGSIDISFRQEYLALTVNESMQLEPNVQEGYNKFITWTTENAEDGASVISVDSTGKVKALHPGTAYAIASVTVGEETYSARCRIDVVEKAGSTQPIADEVSVNGVTLLNTKATVELYHTDYTRIAFMLNLSQNMTTMSFDPTIEDTGHAIEDAWFAQDFLNAYFSLRIVDDRTLEIQPTAEALLNPDAVKSAKSAICLSVDGRDFTTAPLALTVKKTLPTVKAKAVKINSFDAKPVPLTFTGGKVLSVSGVLPKDFKLDGMNLVYTGSAAKASAKLNLFATVENVTLPRPVTVSVSVTRTEPALKLGASSVTLMPGTQDAAQVTVTPAENLELELRDARNNVSNALSCIVRDGKISVFPTNSTETDVTYKLYVNLSGASKKSVLSIKTVSADKAKLTLKAAGAIDTAIPNSPVTLTAKIASYHAGSGEKYKVTVFNSGENVTKLFRIRQENAVLTLTAAGDIPKGTYTAVVGADLGGDGIIDIEKSQKLSVKWSDPNKVPVSVTLKASGSIDVIRPGTAITLTAAFKNWFSYVPSENDIVFYKNKVEMTENIPFTVKIENGNYVISGNGADSSAKYTVAFRAMIGGKQIVSKAIPLSVKMSAVKVSQSVKTISLLKKDRFDSKILEITVPDGTKIHHITQTESSVSSFAVEDLGLGRYAISFRNNRVPPKGTTIKLNVYLVGNLTGKPNATVSVKVNIT